MTRLTATASASALLVSVLGCESKQTPEVAEKQQAVVEQRSEADATLPDRRVSTRERSIVYETPVVMGSLSKETIRRVTKKNTGQIRRCYELELLKRPELSGTVTVKYVIAVTGKVVKAEIERSSLDSAPVHSCIQSALLRWRFPEPKGGGIVVVTYPFIFKAK